MDASIIISTFALLISFGSLLLSYLSYRKSVEFKIREFSDKEEERRRENITWFDFLHRGSSVEGAMIRLTNSNKKAKFLRLKMQFDEDRQYRVETREGSYIDVGERVTISVPRINYKENMMLINFKIKLYFSDMSETIYVQEFEWKNQKQIVNDPVQVENVPA
jgi:hypothetical protein